MARKPKKADGGRPGARRRPHRTGDEETSWLRQQLDEQKARSDRLETTLLRLTGSTAFEAIMSNGLQTLSAKLDPLDDASRRPGEISRRHANPSRRQDELDPVLVKRLQELNEAYRRPKWDNGGETPKLNTRPIDFIGATTTLQRQRGQQTQNGDAAP